MCTQQMGCPVTEEKAIFRFIKLNVSVKNGEGQTDAVYIYSPSPLDVDRILK